MHLFYKLFQNLGQKFSCCIPPSPRKGTTSLWVSFQFKTTMQSFKQMHNLAKQLFTKITIF